MSGSAFNDPKLNPLPPVHPDDRGSRVHYRIQGPGEIKIAEVLTRAQGEREWTLPFVTNPPKNLRNN